MFVNTCSSRTPAGTSEQFVWLVAGVASIVTIEIVRLFHYKSDVFLSLQSLIVRDTVRECLEKDPADRSEDDIEVLLDFMQHLPVSN